jgi:anti-sigma regulatory factor (Ser/Thr protein kinase)
VEQTAAVPHLEVQLTKKLERVYDLAGSSLIGRSPECKVQLLSRAVSRRHALIEVQPSAAVLQDLGAPNGVKVNGSRIKAPQPLKEGDRIVVGDIAMVFRTASRVLSRGETMDVRGGASDEAMLQHLEQARAAFTLPNDPSFLSNYQATIARQRIEKLQVSEDARLKLQIALAEAVENAITHGSGGDASKPIQVVFEETDEEFRLTVRDLGPGFDAEKVLAGAEEVDAIAATQERARFGAGIGLRMILDCVDRLQFESSPGQGTTIHMAKYKDEEGMIVVEDDQPPPPSDDPDLTP